jgi:hypothetical protein
MSPDLRLLIDLVGLALIGLAFLAVVAAWVWITVLAFQTHPARGALCYFVPFEAVTFGLDHWRQARAPALLAVAGALCMATVLVTDVLIDRRYGPRPDPPSTSSSLAAAPDRH